jgi:hypothetical protein
VAKLPQFIFITWDDGVQCASSVPGECADDPSSVTTCLCDLTTNLPADLNYLIDGLKNPSGSKYLYTFFTTQTGTSYDVIENAFANGHEIAGHTVSHGNAYFHQMAGAADYFEGMNASITRKEIPVQRDIITAQTGIDGRFVEGYRMPDLAVNKSYYDEIYKQNFLYDSSLGVSLDYKRPHPPFYSNLPVWPYTLDWGEGHLELSSGGTRSHSVNTNYDPNMLGYKGLWEVPINELLQLGSNCTVFRDCPIERAMEPFSTLNASGVTAGMQHNFDRVYNPKTGNRAPLSIFLHTSWLALAYGCVDFKYKADGMPEANSLPAIETFFGQDYSAKWTKISFKGDDCCPDYKKGAPTCTGCRGLKTGDVLQVCGCAPKQKATPGEKFCAVSLVSSIVSPRLSLI